MIPIVSIKGLHAGYGNTKVLFGVDLDILPGQVSTFMGRNGMGKTTTVRCLMGLLKPSSGQITIHQNDMTGAPPYRIAQAGLGLGAGRPAHFLIAHRQRKPAGNGTTPSEWLDRRRHLRCLSALKPAQA